LIKQDKGAERPAISQQVFVIFAMDVIMHLHNPKMVMISQYVITNCDKNHVVWCGIETVHDRHKADH
jgi:hypothetical protein